MEDALKRATKVNYLELMDDGRNRPEPKIGDQVMDRGHLATIIRFDEDEGTQLSNYSWVCMSEFERGEKGVWVRPNEVDSRLIRIGEKYDKSALSRKGLAVIRSAIFEGGKNPKVVTTSPCCTLHSRRLSFDDLNVMAEREGDLLETCTHCGWHYQIRLEFTGSPRLGLYGVRWISQGH